MPHGKNAEKKGRKNKAIITNYNIREAWKEARKNNIENIEKRLKNAIKQTKR